MNERISLFKTHSSSLVFHSVSFTVHLSAEGNHESEEKEELHSTGENDHFGPKCYYNKAKSFFDNISSDKKFR